LLFGGKKYETRKEKIRENVKEKGRKRKVKEKRFLPQPLMLGDFLAAS
jgi:di/tricarboxylate transporter